MTQTEIATKIAQLKNSTLFSELEALPNDRHFRHFTYCSFPETTDGSVIKKVSTIYARTKIPYVPASTAPKSAPKHTTIISQDTASLIPNCVKYTKTVKYDKAKNIVNTETTQVMLYMKKRTKVHSYYTDTNGNIIPNNIAKSRLKPCGGTYNETYLRYPHLENLMEIKK